MSAVLQQNHTFVRSPVVDVPFHWNTIHVEDDQPFRVYQYTSRVAAESMLSGGEIWASSVLAQNDPLELTYGMDLLEERWLQVQGEDEFHWLIPQTTALLRKLRHSFTKQEECFIACASTLPRSLSLFRMYGEVRLEISKDIPMELVDLDAHQYNKMGYAGGLVWPWQRVRYSERDATALADMMLSLLAEAAMSLYVYPTEDRFEPPVEVADIRPMDYEYFYSRARAYYANVVCFVKSAYWEEEKEVRLLARLPFGDGARKERVRPGDRVGYVALRPDLDRLGTSVTPVIYETILVGPSREGYESITAKLTESAEAGQGHLAIEDAKMHMRFD